MATMTSVLDAELEPESIHRLTLIDDGSSVTVSDVRLIATGLRNAASLAFHPSNGDLYLQDNGIDRPDDPVEPLSADEINVIAAGRLGRTVVDFGFPTDYVEYRTGTRVGLGAEEPLVAIQPIDESEAEGAAEMAFAPPGFPDGLADGLFVGFHGRFSLAGLENEENPLLYVDPASGSYFEFIPNALPGVGHLDKILATEDSLFIADLNSKGTLGTPQAEGVIYQIKAVS
jgi:hypothetical protein